MRLFNDERQIGWASNDLSGNNVPWISLGISVAFLCFTFLFRRYTKLPTLSIPTMAVICLITIPVATILFYRSGKASLLPPRAGVVVQNWGCCTQGLVIPREQVPGLTKELRDKAATKSADITVIDYADEHKLRRYALNPVQVQHMG